MTPLPCPKCKSNSTYPDSAALWTCAECFHEWREGENTPESSDETKTESAKVLDSNGNELRDGDSVVVMRDLKIKGASSTIKSGTKVRNIRLIPNPIDGHNFACKIDGVGAVNLKSEFVKKSS